MHDKDFWKLLIGDDNIEITLIIPHQDIVFGQMPLDEFRLADERLDFAFGFYPRERRCLLAHLPHFLRDTNAKIRSKPLFQISGFADVNRCFFTIEYINASGVRNRFGLNNHQYLYISFLVKMKGRYPSG